MFHYPSAVRVLFVIICLFPGSASAALIWDFEVSDRELSGTGQFEVDAPSPGNLLAFSFSGQVFGHTYTLSTADIVTSFWDIDRTTWTLTNAVFVSAVVATDTPRVESDLILTTGVTGANCGGPIAASLCGGTHFDFRQGTAVFSPSQPNQPVPEPTSLLLLASGLVALAGYRWHQGQHEAV